MPDETAAGPEITCPDWCIINDPLQHRADLAFGVRDHWGEDIELPERDADGGFFQLCLRQDVEAATRPSIWLSYGGTTHGRDLTSAQALQLAATLTKLASQASGNQV
ncbi:MAG: DUF6907 domain-containing protein [Actinomycetes bacterium]